MSNQEHIPVLKKEALHYLDLRSGAWVVDATLGLGGHAEEILEVIGPDGRLIAIDQDAENLQKAKNRLERFPNVTYLHLNFENIGEALQEYDKKIHGVLFDLGLSSPHVDDPERGFSFMNDGPLDMRFDTRQNLNASDIVNTWPVEPLTNIFRLYGEEKNAWRIANEIVRERKNAPITRTTQLASLIERCSRRGPGKHPATRVFQALRIAVNGEIEALEKALPAVLSLLSKGGRIVAISYHSLEDRVVKNFFKAESNDCVCDKVKEPVCICGKVQTLKIITKKPITPSSVEAEANPRARSAKLRAAEKIV